MAKLKHEPVVYPTARSEYHITTPTGVISGIHEDKVRALEIFKGRPSSWKLIEVTLTKVDITPELHDLTAPLQLHMSQVLVG